MANSSVCDEALKNPEVLDLVIKSKQVFYYYKDANYDLCATGNIRLIPDELGIKGLKQDYQDMVDGQLFFKAPPEFDEIINSLKDLETKINSTYSKFSSN